MQPTDQSTTELQKTPKNKWRQRHRFLWVLAWLFGGVIGLITVAVVGLGVFANTQKGQKYLANQIGELTGHSIEVSGLSGSFPNHLRVATIELKDPKIGVWLSLKQTELDWSLLALLGKKVQVSRLYAKEINVYDLPPSDESAPEETSPSSSSGMVIGANVKDLQIDKLFVSGKVAPIDLVLGGKGKINVKDVLKIIDMQSLDDLSNVNLSLHLWELNQATELQLSADIGDKKVNKASLIINTKKQSDGLIERLSKMDQLTPLALNVSLQGPLEKLQTKLDLSAAQTKLNVNGDIDLIHSAMNIALLGHSPAMTLSPTIGWGGWNLDAKLYGAFKSPAGAGKFELTDLAAGDAMVNKLLLQFKGEDLTSLAAQQDLTSSPWIRLKLMADGLRIPGSQPKLLAGSPLSLDLVYHPTEKDEPVNLQLNHQLIKAAGRILIKPALHGSLDLYVPELAPLAKAGNVDLKGLTVLNVGFALPEDPKNPIDLDLDGSLMVTGGLPIAVQMVGSQGHIGLHAQVTQEPTQKIMLQSLVFNGRHINLDVNGSLIGEQVKALLNLDVKDLSAAAPMLKGKANAQVNIDGSLQDLAAQLKLSTSLSTTAKSEYSLRPSQLELTANAQHLPSKPIAVVGLTGKLDQTPVNIKLQAGLAEKEKQYYFKLEQMEWRGLKAVADVVLPEKSMFPIGTIKLDVARLSDFGRLVNQKIDGSIHLDIHSLAERTSKLLIDLTSQISMPQAKIGKLSLSGFVDDPETKPFVNLKLQANQLQVPQIVQGNALMTASGGMDNLKLTLNGNFPSLLDAKGNIDTALVLDLLKKKANIQKFTALIKGENIRLLAPLQAEFGEKVGVNRLRISVAPVGEAPAMIDIAGTIKPNLALTASIQNITPALAKPFAPDLHAKGVINAQAQLKGSLEKPQGNIRLNAQNMQLTSGSAASLPPAQLTALANLNGNTARLDTKLQVGQKVNLNVNGTVPLQTKGNIALGINGNIDLAVANAIVGASAQQVKGLINIAMQVNGNMNAPAITGGINLTNGSFRDYAQGVTIRDIQASIQGQRDHIILQSFSAKAGDGTMSADGQIGVFQPGIPINLHFGMNKAKPLVSDLLTAVMDGDINIKGMAKTRIDVGGVVKIKRADINIPHSMARSVTPLKVIRPGDKVETTQSSSSGPEIGLDLTIKSVGQIIVRGFGLFTDMAGSIHIGGNADAPQISGGFAMKNGHIDMAGISLEFTKGVIGFKGSNVDHKIDPSLDFEVKKSVEGNTVSLGITGYASSPKISLTSSPPLSQDRVLAMLLFGVDSQSLSTTQMAEIGVALATLGGEGSGFDPIGTVRKSLGLDRLSVGGGSSSSNQGPTSGTSVSAGKYLTKGVYLGAKQSTGTQGTQAEVQVDITKRLKATATVGTGEDRSGFVTPDNDPGSSIGLLYKFDY